MRRKILARFVKGMILAIALLDIAIFGCPIYELIGVVCPCCGVTRAWLAFFQGNLPLAFRYHALFLVIPVIGVMYVYRCFLPGRCEKWITVIMCGLAVAVFVYAVLRWLGYVAIPS